MSPFTGVSVLAAIGASALGCASSPLGEDFRVPARPLGAMYETSRADRDGGEAASWGRDRAFAEPTGDLTMRDAVAAALLGSPVLMGYAYDVRTAEARAVQAGRLPNPEFEAEIENALGSGDLRDGDGTEVTAVISQLIQLGGDRRARRRVAAAERDLAGWEYEAQRIGVVSDVATRYHRLLAVQGRLELARENERLAEDLYQAVTRQIEAGEVAGVERNRAEVARARVRLQTRRLERELSSARHRLAATWGSTQPRFTEAAGELGEPGTLPDRARMLAAVVESPDLARFAAEVARGRAGLDLARAEGVPDLTLAAGAKYLRESDDVGLVVGVGIPLPLFDRNQSNVLAARAELARTLTQRRAAEVVARTAVAVAYEELAAAHDEAAALRDELIPAAQRSYDAVQEAYRQGEVSTLEVLDAGRTLIELKQERLDALAAYRGATVQAEALIARPLSSLSDVTGAEAAAPSGGPDEVAEPGVGLPGISQVETDPSTGEPPAAGKEASPPAPRIQPEPRPTPLDVETKR